MKKPGFPVRFYRSAALGRREYSAAAEWSAGVHSRYAVVAPNPNPEPLTDSMTQPITGVTPAELTEVPCKVIWPTIGAMALGRLVGRLSSIRFGWGEFFTLGKLLAVATLPFSLIVFGWQLTPYGCRRYMLTNRRIIVRKGLMAVDQRWISFDDFDTIDIEVLPGQEWFHAGDLVCRHGGIEVLRLAGVPRPEALRQVCLSMQSALVSVRSVVEHQAAKTTT